MRSLRKRALEKAATEVSFASRVASGAEASTSCGNTSCGNLYTMAQLQAASVQAATQGVRRLKELGDLSERIPLLVSSIWGRQSVLVVRALREQRCLAAKLIRRWEDAEGRLIAMANSLSISQSGQKLVAVGVPLAAAHLLQRGEPAHCYSAVAAAPAPAPPSLVELGVCALRTLGEELALAARAIYLWALFLPAVLSSPACLLAGAPRDRWLNLMRWTLERAGPAFIKWGQWAATRPDLFAPDVCAALAALQTAAPRHSFAHTRAAVEAAFGAPLGELFASFDIAPVASGSIAQVHRATLTARGSALAAGAPGRGRPDARFFSPGMAVAVKVRHPGVSEVMERDFQLMQRAGSFLGSLPLAGAPQIKESLMQFGAPLREQLDLRAEAAHLAKFGTNFRFWSGVRFPAPAGPGLVASDVLVESFEAGKHISAYVDAPGGQYNKKLAGLGLNCYLQMLLRDNFIHADLHPGNILVTLDAPAPGSLAAAASRLLHVPLRVPRLVLLDVGMTAALTDTDQANLVAFFKSLTEMDGAAVADAVMAFSRTAPPRPAAFRTDMAELFDSLDAGALRTRTCEIMSAMMDTVREHQVHLQGVVSTVVITTMVLEGWSTKLDPDIRILDTLRDILPTAWHERAGRGVDRVMSSGALALAS